MFERFVFLGRSSRSKRAARAYWTEKRRRFERLLSSVPPELRRLRLVLRRLKTGWESHAVLTLPSAVLVSGAEGQGWAEAVDEMADRLAAELRRHLSRRRERPRFWPTAS